MKCESYTFYLPDKCNNCVEKQVNSNSVIIIGANGAGKSSLGAWMEQQNPKQVHRIGAQRSLVFGNFIQQKSYEQSTNLLLCGTEEYQANHNHRWGYDGEKFNYTSSVLHDYENVLSALIAKQRSQNEKYIAECRTLEKEKKLHNNVPEMVTDVLQRIWDSVFLQRAIRLDDGKVMAIFEKDGKTVKYKGRDMSDGERVALYLISQALCVPENKTIIIDEPEIHLHRSIMNRLWTSIEKERQDCLFIYITHDTQFASNHHQATKIWVKEFDGIHWEWEEIQNSTLPENLKLNILGNRRPVLFVEGNSDSYDTKLYTKIYKDYYIVPCGGCTNVILETKAMRSTPQLHHLNCCGLIDRDFRNENEIHALESHGIYTLDVAEVENLFLVEEVLIIANSILGFQDMSRIEKIKQYIINRFSKQIASQVYASAISELKYQLSIINFDGMAEANIKNSIHSTLGAVKYEAILHEKEKLLEEALQSKKYSAILKLFNEKGLAKSIGHYLGLNNQEYCEFILRQLDSDYGEKLRDAFQKYLPLMN